MLNKCLCGKLTLRSQCPRCGTLLKAGDSDSYRDRIDRKWLKLQHKQQ